MEVEKELSEGRVGTGSRNPAARAAALAALRRHEFAVASNEVQCTDGNGSLRRIADITNSNSDTVTTGDASRTLEASTQPCTIASELSTAQAAACTNAQKLTETGSGGRSALDDSTTLSQPPPKKAKKKHAPLFAQEVEFHQRLSALYKGWRAGVFNGDKTNCDALLICAGALPPNLSPDENKYSDLTAFDAFMKWLFGGSTFGTTLSNTAIFCCKQEVALFSSDKKLHILSSILLAAPKIGPTITFLSRTEPEKSMRHIRNMLDKCVLVAGVESSFGSEFTTACRELVPTKARFSDCTAIAADYCTTLKTRSDRQDVRNAAKAAIQLVDKTCFDLVRCYEFHELVTQRNVVDALIETPLREEFGRGYTLAYPPTVEFGGTFSVRARDRTQRKRAQQLLMDGNQGVSDGEISFDVLICSVGVKYRGWCSNVARTLLFTRTPAVVEAYHLLKDIRVLVLQLLKPGQLVHGIYTACEKLIEDRQPDLLPHFQKHVGHTMGYRFREGTTLDGKMRRALESIAQQINPRSKQWFKVAIRCKVSRQRIQSGQVYNIQVGFGALQTASQEKESPDVTTPPVAALLIADTVTVLGKERRLDQGFNEVLTPFKDHFVKRRDEAAPPLNFALSYELMVYIFSFLDVVSLGRACQVCKYWSGIPWTTVDVASVRGRIRLGNSSQMSLARGRAAATRRLAQKGFERQRQSRDFKARSELSTGGVSAGLGDEMYSIMGRDDAYRSFIANRGLRRVWVRSQRQVVLFSIRYFTHARHKHIKVLNLEGCKLQAADYHALPHLYRLEELNLNGSTFPYPKNRGGNEFFVSVDEKPLYPSGIAELAKLLSRADCKMKVLELAHSGINKGGMEVLCKGLSENTSLKDVRLQGNPMGDTGIRCLAEVIRHTQNLQHIWLCPVARIELWFFALLVSPSGFEEVVQAISVNDRLTMADLDAPMEHRILSPLDAKNFASDHLAQALAKK